MRESAPVWPIQRTQFQVSREYHEGRSSPRWYSHLGDSHLKEAVERITAKPTDTNTDTEQSKTQTMAKAKSA
jgi:hypothetical protein